MTERPIIFQDWGVRAILPGLKTQTRRIIRPPKWSTPDRAGVDFPCPYGVPGDRLWVRETWSPGMGANNKKRLFCDGIYYWADGAFLPNQRAPEIRVNERIKRASIHMPRWASRIMLEITDVRVQRVQEITNEDAIAELGGTAAGIVTERGHFMERWDSINSERGYSWDVNPWTWALTFKIVEDRGR